MFFSNNFKEQYQVHKGEDDLRLLPGMNYLATHEQPRSRAADSSRTRSCPPLRAPSLLAAPPSEIRSTMLGDGVFRPQHMSTLYLLRYRVRFSGGDVK